MKNKIKTKSFWIGLAGAVIMLLQAFGLKINVPVINEVISSLCAIAILLGVMIDDTKKTENTANVSDKTQQILADPSTQESNLTTPIPAEDTTKKSIKPVSDAEDSETTQNSQSGGISI